MPSKKTTPRKTSTKSASKAPAKRAATKTVRKAAKKAVRKRATKAATNVVPFPGSRSPSTREKSDVAPAEYSIVEKVLSLIRQLPERYGKEILGFLEEHGPAMAEPHVARLARTAKKPALKVLFHSLHYAIKLLPGKRLR